MIWAVRAGADCHMANAVRLFHMVIGTGLLVCSRLDTFQNAFNSIPAYSKVVFPSIASVPDKNGRRKLPAVLTGWATVLGASLDLSKTVRN